MNLYRDFSYKKNKGNSYTLVFPSGFKTLVYCDTDEEIKAAIDQIIEQSQSGG